MEYLISFLYGLVQGVTEFLPVSSTGHLLLLSHILGPQWGYLGQLLVVVIQAGSMIAVMGLFASRIATLVRIAPRLLVAFLPSVIAGLILYPCIKNTLFNAPLVIASALIGGGGIMLALERWYTPRAPRPLGEVSVRDAFIIGIAQCFALVPGVSRSGATIVGGMLAGLARSTAVEFSFLLALPTIAAASVLDVWSQRALFTSQNIPVVLWGVAVSALVSYGVMKWLMKYVSTHTFRPFAWYRIAAGVVILVLLLK